MLRVAILSDTHGEIDDRILAVVAGCDIAIHGGDVGNASILRRLQPRSGRVVAVYGNNDTERKWPVGQHDLLACLSHEATLDLPGGTLCLIHGHQTAARGRHAKLRQRYPDARVVVYGHSHRLVTDLDAEPWVLNPGAAGRERTYGGPSCIVLTVGEPDWSLEVIRFEPNRHRPGSGRV
jgi:putative phosphoesterase